MTCDDAIAYETLVAYWLGEVPGDREATLEEHLFACEHCSGRLAAFVALASGVRTAVTTGKVAMVASAPFVDAMKQAGLRVREYLLGPGDSVNCTICTDDDAVIARMRAPLAGVERVDLASTVGDGPEMRLADVPFDPRSGEVLMIPSTAWLKTMSSFTMRTRLLAVSAAGETPLGDYTFNHSPS